MKPRIKTFQKLVVLSIFRPSSWRFMETRPLKYLCSVQIFMATSAFFLTLGGSYLLLY